MKLRHLEVLNAILQTGSITQAAKLLAVTQPSISAALQHCEAQVGIQLFERSGGRLKPTPEALALLPDIREIFRRVDRVRENAISLAQGRLGSISVAGTLALSNGYLVDTVARFRRQYPGVDVMLHSLQTPDIVERVLARELDIGVCYGPVANSALEVEVIASRDLICVLPENHPLAAKARLAVADLASETLISYVAGDRLRGKIDALFRDLEQKPAYGIQVSQTITAIRLAKAGAGIALVEPYFFAAIRPSGMVARAIVPTEALTVEAVSLAGVVQSTVAVEFMKMLREVAKDAA
ncbi:MAG: LysR family transcriptional regulator [Pseudomonadota bacterium]